MAYRKLVIRIWGVIFNHVVLKYRPLQKKKKNHGHGTSCVAGEASQLVYFMADFVAQGIDDIGNCHLFTLSRRSCLVTH